MPGAREEPTGGTARPVDELMWEPGAPGEVAPLRAASCDECGRVTFPSPAQCPVCASATTSIPLGPHAQLGHATAVLHEPPGTRVPVPYVVGVARFDEGVSVLGLVVVDDLQHLAPGDDIDVVVHSPTPELVTYAFRPI